MARWTDALDARLRQLADSGLTAKEIAATLSSETGDAFTRNSVIGRSHRRHIVIGAARTDLEKVLIARASGKKAAKLRPRNEPAHVTQVSLAPLSAAPAEAPHAVSLMSFNPVIPEPANGEGLSLMELTGKSCRFVVSKPDALFARFCGADRESGSSYCPGHHGIVWVGKRFVSEKSGNPSRKRMSAYQLRAAP
jgi:hypothetical protein